MRAASLGTIIASGLLAGCALERAQIAEDARSQMLGMSKETVLACMGPPNSRMAEGSTEVWAYQSGNGHVDMSVHAHGVGHMATGSGVATNRFCSVQVVMQGGRVARLNYAGPTGGLLTPGEQCAFAVRNCVRSQVAVAR
jgi:hypothetical protein